jgi:translation elongation factor EF-G
MYSNELRASSYIVNVCIKKKEHMRYLVKMHANKHKKIPIMHARDIAVLISFKNIIKSNTIVEENKLILLE